MRLLPEIFRACKIIKMNTNWQYIRNMQIKNECSFHFTSTQFNMKFSRTSETLQKKTTTQIFMNCPEWWIFRIRLSALSTRVVLRVLNDVKADQLHYCDQQATISQASLTAEWQPSLAQKCFFNSASKLTPQFHQRKTKYLEKNLHHVWKNVKF